MHVTATLGAPATRDTIRSMPRLPMLDGWRGISILAVLMAHMLPLPPKRFHFNYASGVFGMALFFALSGFLITTTLFFHPSVRTFLIRRFCRIIPAAFLYIGIVLTVLHASRPIWLAHIFFYENLPPFHLTIFTSNLWSLCVEMQFYIGIAVLFLLFRQKGLALLPFLCVAVTLFRIYHRVGSSIVTIARVDEILSGATLAFLYHGNFSRQLKSTLTRINPFIPLVLLMIASHPAFLWMNYLRPYFAAILIGSTLYATRPGWAKFLKSKPLVYLASISYALYIWNEFFHNGWFEAGSKVAKYSKRPLGIGLNFLIAHVSTFYFEKFWINLGKRLTTARRA